MNIKLSPGLYTRFFGHISDGIVLTDDELNIVYHNSAFRDMFDIIDGSGYKNLADFFAAHSVPADLVSGIVEDLNPEHETGEHIFSMTRANVNYHVHLTILNLAKQNIHLFTFQKTEYQHDLKSFLLQNAAFFDLLSLSIHEIFYYFDYFSNSYLYISRNVEDFLGYSLDEINAIGFQKLIKKIEKVGVPVVNPDINTLHKQAASGYGNEYLLKVKDGTHKWFEENGTKVKDNKGRLIGQFGSLRNITKEKSIFFSLRETEHNLKSLLDFTPIGIMVVQDMNIVYANNELMKILKLPRDHKIEGQPLDSITTKECADEIKSIYDRVGGKKEHIYDYLFNAVNYNSEKLSIQGNLIPIQYAGSPAVQFVCKDITAQARADKARLATLRILEAAEIIPDLNEFFEFIHKTLSEVIPIKNFFIALVDKPSGMLDFAYLVDEYDSASDELAEPTGLTGYVIKTGKSCLVDKVKDEELRKAGMVELQGEPAAIWLGVPLKIQNEIIGAMVVQDYYNKDIYSLKEQDLLETIAYSISYAVERKRRDKERYELINQLKEINASKDSLFSIISHDLRSPFNSILGFVNILLNDYKELDYDEVFNLLTSLKNVTNNVLNMLFNLLEYSRFQLGRIDYLPEPVNLKALTLYVVQLLQGNFGKKDINPVIEVDESIIAFADEKMITSVLQNLISNSLKFSPHGKKIFIIAAFNAEGMIEVSVEDQGLGMYPQQLEKLFRIENVQSTFGTDNEVGSGLGLILVKNFISRHGGTIWATSKKGEGSKFTFTLPPVKPA